MSIKIGIIAVGYQSEWIKHSLAPWILLKKGGENTEPDKDIELYISCTAALFKQRQEAGETYNNTENERYLETLLSNKCIDNLNIIKDPILDFESRNYCLDYLRNHDLDLIWQLDFGDEIYSVDNIKNIISYIKKNQYYDWYKIFFKNFVGDTKHYVDNFCPPRIHWIKKNGGVDKFVWDNDLRYKNGKHSNEVAKIAIPKNIAQITHYSWCGSPEFLQKKIQYQLKTLGVCSYLWDDKQQCIAFNPEYYKKIGQPIPELKTI